MTKPADPRNDDGHDDPAVVYTIGVYGADARAFFATLTAARIGLLVDIRRRRAVRGPVYAYANAQRLTAELAKHGIVYRHELALAPDEEALALQHRADRAGGTAFSERTKLDPAYIRRYRAILARFDAAAFADDVRHIRRLALMCIERTPYACHRSLAAPVVAAAIGGRPVVHLDAARRC